MFVSHARTVEEARAEFLSDINRNITNLRGQMNGTARSAAERSRIARAIAEFEQLETFWREVAFVPVKPKGK